MIAMIRAKTNPHTGISVGQARTVAMDIPKKTKKTTRYHHSGTGLYAFINLL
ncbi:hypothetical protein MGK_05547 [Candida albicans P57055]|nr:hypothetical protein MGK_05547 [Candida albicans P57055]